MPIRPAVALSCWLLGHEWGGCRCRRCRRRRDREHAWVGCLCRRCGAARDEEHDLVGCRCRTCRRAFHRVALGACVICRRPACAACGGAGSGATPGLGACVACGGAGTAAAAS